MVSFPACQAPFLGLQALCLLLLVPFLVCQALPPHLQAVCLPCLVLLQQPLQLLPLASDDSCCVN